MEQKFTIKGMHCKSCVMLITDAVEDLGVKIISFKMDEKAKIGTLVIEGNIDRKKVKEAIESEGDYQVQ